MEALIRVSFVESLAERVLAPMKKAEEDK